MSNNPMQIHETVLRDIVDLISGVSKEMNSDNGPMLKGSMSGTSFRSASKAASNLTLVFPVVAEESVSLDTARMTCKAIERKAVGMMQMLFSAICITDSRNAIDYIKNLHTNINLDDSLDVNEFISIMDKMSVDESAGITITDRSVFDAVKEDMKFIDCHLTEEVNPPLNRFVVPYDVEERAIIEADGDFLDTYKTFSQVSKDQVIDTEVKKANELVPTLMTIHIVAMVDGNPVPTTAIVGIKAKLQYVSRQDMINRIVLKNKDKNGLFNFLRASTREISFWKDFAFAVDRAKLDALSTSGRGSSDRIWKMLERRAIKSRMKRFTGMMNDASSITTILISQETADVISKEEHIDISKARTLLPIMEAYNLMAFVIADEVNEKEMFLFDDGSGEFETVSFTHLEREESGNYKKIINLLAKSR